MGQSASQPQPTPGTITVAAAAGADGVATTKVPNTLDEYRDVRGKVPVVYSPDYNIAFWGMENLHPFDSKKYMKVYDALLSSKTLRAEQVYAPPMATDAQLKLVHSDEYLKSLEDSATVARITEVPPVAWLPASTARARVLVPMLYATGGTILGAVLAVEGPSAAASATTGAAGASAATAATAPVAADAKDAKTAGDGKAADSKESGSNGFGWAINLSGGYHHACSHAGGGFCVYADISMAILTVAKRNPSLKRFMIVDLDAHQGNGHENDKRVGVFEGLQVFTLDMYNAAIYPRDIKAKKYIDCRVELKPHTADAEYLALERQHLTHSLKAFHPQLIVYNAGTDILEGDPLGQLSITGAGIVKRDEIVFELARVHGNVPVLMLLSGGYQKSNAAVIAQSIENLNTKFGLVAGALAKTDPKAAAAAATATAVAAPVAAAAASASGAVGDSKRAAL